MVAVAAAVVESNRRFLVSAIAQAKGASKKTIYCILTGYLGLVKKTASRVPTLLSPELKDERVGTS